MPTLREYLRTATGRFSAPNHPVPLTPEEMERRLEGDEGPIPGRADFDVDLLDLPVQVENQTSGDRWIYPAERNLEIEREPLLIHHPSP